LALANPVVPLAFSGSLSSRHGSSRLVAVKRVFLDVRFGRSGRFPNINLSKNANPLRHEPLRIPAAMHTHGVMAAPASAQPASAPGTQSARMERRALLGLGPRRHSCQPLLGRRVLLDAGGVPDKYEPSPFTPDAQRLSQFFEHFFAGLSKKQKV
jgi:hypothetical protein